MSSKIFEGVLRFKQRLITETNLFIIAEPFRRFTVIVQCFYEQCKLCIVFQNEFSAADDLFQEGRVVALLIIQNVLWLYHTPSGNKSKDSKLEPAT